MNWSKIKTWFPIIGIILFVYLLWKLDVRQVFLEISSLNFNYIVLAALVLVIYFLFQTFKWYIIAIKQRMNLSFLEALKINFISHFYGFVTPSKIGSIIRAEYLKKYSGSIGKGISNFVIDKILDLSSLFILAIVFSFMLGEKFDFIPLQAIIILFLVFCVFSLVLMKKNWLKAVSKKFKWMLPKSLEKKLRIVFSSFYEDMPDKTFIVGVFIINIFTWILIYLVSYFIGLSLGINVPFYYFLAILPIATLIAQIPITINGLGTREVTLIGLFGLFGVSATKVFSMSILGIFLSGIFPCLIALFLIWKEK